MAKPFLSLETKNVRGLQLTLIAYPKEFKKPLRRIMREAMKLWVLPTAKRNMAVLSGRMKKATKVRAAKGRGGKRLPRTQFGSAVVVLVDYARFVLLDRKNRDGTVRRGDRTLRNALYDNEDMVRQYYISEGNREANQLASDMRRKHRTKV